MRRVVDILGALLIVGVVIALALPSYGEYTPRASVSAAISLLLNSKTNLESACADGTFAAKHKPTDIGLPDSEPKAFVMRTELVRVTPNVVRLKATLTDIYSHPPFWPFPWKVISQGNSLQFEHTCSEDRKFSTRFAGSTLEPKYLPASLRGQ